MGVDVEFHNGLIRVNSVEGDHVGFSRALPLSRRRRLKGQTWWEAPVADATGAVAFADSKGLMVEPQVRDHAVRLWQEEALNFSTATAAASTAGPTPRVRGLESSLLETQSVVVAASSRAWYCPPGQEKDRHRAMILADDQGLGKTLTALASLRLEGHETSRVVIVCPTSLTENWHKEIAEHFTHGTFTPWTATGKTPSAIPEDVDTVVIGWEILADWSQALIEWAPDALLADEGHYAKSGKQRKSTTQEPKRDEQGHIIYKDDGLAVMEKVTKVVGGSARATALLDLGKSVAKCGGLIMPMTGTPIVNRPLELLPLLELSGIEKLFVSGHEFKERFCGPTWKTVRGGRKARDYQGATNLLELNTRLLTSGAYFRRTKQVLVDQGMLKRKYVDKAYFFDYAATPRPWTIRLTPQERAEYEAAKAEAQGFFTTRAEEIAAEKRSSVRTQAVQKKVAAEGAKHLKVITELRQATARLKVPYVVHQAQRLVDRGEKVVIVAHHRDVVAAYAEEFGGLRIQGDMGSKAIEEAKGLFNGTSVSENPVMVLSVEAGKTGHTLCKQAIEGVGPACAYMIFAEQIWTPGDEAQAQDRIWRIGQDREVFVSNALVDESIDQSIYWQRRKKRWVFNAAIDSIDQASMESAKSEKSGAGELAHELVYGAVPRTAVK